MTIIQELQDCFDHKRYEEICINKLLIPVSLNLLKELNVDSIFICLLYEVYDVVNVSVQFIPYKNKVYNLDKIYYENKNLSIHNNRIYLNDEAEKILLENIQKYLPQNNNILYYNNRLFTLCFSKYCEKSSKSKTTQTVKDRYTPFLFITKNNIRYLGKLNKVWK